MNHSRDPQFFIELEKVLDEQFPKGECKERGAALMVFAEANRLHNELLKEAEQRGADGVCTYINIRATRGQGHADGVCVYEENLQEVLREARSAWRGK